MVAVLLFSLHSFGSTRIHCIWSDPDPGKEIEVDPDPAKCSGSGWIRIRIRNAAFLPLMTSHDLEMKFSHAPMSYPDDRLSFAMQHAHVLRRKMQKFLEATTYL